MKVTVGTAPDSWGVWFPSDVKQTPWSRFLDEVVEAGIEPGPYGYLPSDPVALQSELQQRHLHVCAATVIGNLEQPSAWPDLERQILGSGL
jgi:inosose dehydratase